MRATRWQVPSDSQPWPLPLTACRCSGRTLESRRCKHLHVDGNGFSGRLDELLTLGGAVLKQDSPFAAYYYPLLRRGVHYEPLARNLSDVCSASAALLSDLPGRAHKLASAASRFARRFLSPEAVAQYVVALLRQYAYLQRFVPSLHPQAVPWREDRQRSGGGGAGQRRSGHGSGAVTGAVQFQRSGSGASVAAACSSPACCQRHPKACTQRVS